MKDILFRGKRIDTKEFAIGSHILIDGINYILPENMPLKYIVEVRKESVGQYINMDDNSCKNIFEGDVLKITTEEQVMNCIDPYSKYTTYRNEQRDGIYVVYFDEALCEYRFKLQYYETGDCYYRKQTYSKRISVHDYTIKEKFVVGNIYDNPELLLDNIK